MPSLKDAEANVHIMADFDGTGAARAARAPIAGPPRLPSHRGTTSGMILYITTATEEDDWDEFAAAKFQQLRDGWQKRRASTAPGVGGGFAMIAFTVAGHFTAVFKEGMAGPEPTRLTQHSTCPDLDIQAIRDFVAEHFVEGNTHLVLGVHGAGDAFSFNSVALNHILLNPHFDRETLGGRVVDPATKRVEGPVDYPIEDILWDLFYLPELESPISQPENAATLVGVASTAAAAVMPENVASMDELEPLTPGDTTADDEYDDPQRKPLHHATCTTGEDDHYRRFLSVTLDSCLMGELHTISACHDIANYLIAPEGYMWEEDVDVDNSIFNPVSMQLLWSCHADACYQRNVRRLFATAPPSGDVLKQLKKKRCEFMERELTKVVQHYCTVSSSGDASLFSTWNGRRMITCLDDWTEELQVSAAEEPCGVLVSRWTQWSFHASTIVNNYVATHPDTKAEKRRHARRRAKEARKTVEAECDHLPPIDVEAALKRNAVYDGAGEEDEEDRLVDMPLNHHNFYVKSDDLNFHGRWLLDGWSALSELLAAQKPVEMKASLRLMSPIDAEQRLESLGVSPIVIEEVVAFWKQLFKQVVLHHEGPRDASLYVVPPRGFSISLQRSLLGSAGSGHDVKRHYVPHELLRVNPSYVSDQRRSEHSYMSSGTET